MKKLLSFVLASAFLLGSAALLRKASAEEKITGYDKDSVPRVLPMFRQWEGDGKGEFFVFDEDTRIAAFEGIDETAAEMFYSVSGIRPGIIAEDDGGSNLIVFEISAASVGNAEGYRLYIEKDRIKVVAPTEKGLFYGAVTLSQMLYTEGFIRCGSALDYPEYQVRSGMIDVGRTYVPLDYVEEIAKYMAWFKLNEIHLHINDCNSTVNSGFRLESDFPGLSTVKNGEKQYYTKDEYRAFQKRLLKYGVTVVTEIDTPAHSTAFANITKNGPPILGGTSLDIRDEHRDESLAFVKALFDEYLKGDDPVFVGKVVHIGTDEYNRDYSEEMRKYTAELAAYIHSLGYTPRFWAGLGKDGFQGTTPIPSYLQANMWDNGISGIEQLVSGGYDIVNTLNALLYVVPTGNGFPDYLDLEYLYNNWQVNLFNGWGWDKKVEPDYEHLLGACFALWNDLSYMNIGVTKYDMFDRIRGMAAIVAEKSWCGNETSKIDYSDFAARFDSLSFRSALSDPGRHILKTEPGINSYLVYDEFDSSSPDDGLTLNGKTENGAFILDGESSLSFAGGSLGFPATLSVTLRLDEISGGPLFGSPDSAIYADVDGKGHVGFKIDSYTFVYDYTIPVGEKVTLSFACDGKKTVLAVGEFKDMRFVDCFCYDPVNSGNTSGNRLANLIMPLAEIGKGFKGSIESIIICDIAAGTYVLSASRNLALNCKTEVSGLEVDDGRFHAGLAVDGKEETRLSFARDKDEQWLILDLGSEYEIRRVVIDFFEHVSSYDIFVSADGKDYTKVYSLEGGETKNKQTDTIVIPSAPKARFVKYVQNKRNYYEQWDAYYSGGISEIEVYSYDRSVYNALISEALDAMMELGNANELTGQIRAASNKLENYLDSPTVYYHNLNALSERLRSLIDKAHAPEPVPGGDEGSVAGNSKDDGSDNKSKGFPVGAAVAVAAAAAAAGVAIAVKKRKKNQK